MSTGIKAAWIGAVALIVAAVVGAILQPSWWHRDPIPSPVFTIAGSVVDQDSNRGVGQAQISVEGRSETYLTEDNGNFRFDLQGPFPADGTVRLHVTKAGYLPADETTKATERLTVQLGRK
jgi:hypothetical protein